MDREGGRERGREGGRERGRDTERDTHTFTHRQTQRTVVTMTIYFLAIPSPWKPPPPNPHTSVPDALQAPISGLMSAAAAIP